VIGFRVGSGQVPVENGHQENHDADPKAAPTTVVASCPHCFNTIAREYPQLGGDFEVIHHTQLLVKLVQQGRIKPVTSVEEKLTYHDPCFLGRTARRCGRRAILPGRPAGHC